MAINFIRTVTFQLKRKRRKLLRITEESYGETVTKLIVKYI